MFTSREVYAENTPCSSSTRVVVEVALRSLLAASRSSTIEGASASCSGCCRSASLLVVNAACSGFCAHRPTVPPTPARPRRGLGFPRTTSLEAAPRLGSSRPREAGAEVLGQKARPSCPARVHRERASCLLPHAPHPDLLQPPPPRCPGGQTHALGGQEVTETSCSMTQLPAGALWLVLFWKSALLLNWLLDGMLEGALRGWRPWCRS